MTSIKLKLSDIMLNNFYDFHKAINEPYLKYIAKGGRGSGKSSHIATELILDIIKYPITILCVRKVGNTLQESCYEQLKEAISIMKLDGKFKFNLNPLKITYLPRGNTIIFRGADDPAKIKSIKMSKYPIARLWIEELAEFKSEDDVGMIEKSILRAELKEGLNYKFYYSYNPPKRKQSWVNKRYETQFLAKNTYVHKSTYLDNIFLSKAFIDEAEHIKETQPLRYAWEYLGEPVGSGVVPFDNLVFENITDEQIVNFDNIRDGVDWGYATDPLAHVRIHYDKTRRKIYIFDEIYKIKLSNREYSEIVKSKGIVNCILADSAEPKSIDECRGYGLNILGASKGPGSVEFGEKWLDDLEAIVIDPRRCPNTAREFESIDYEVDKNGDIKNRLEDKNNHTIDATRYGLSNDMVKNFSFDW